MLLTLGWWGVRYRDGVGLGTMAPQLLELLLHPVYLCPLTISTINRL